MPGFDRDHPLCFNGLGRVDQKVHEDLVKLLGIASGKWYFSVFLFNRAFVFQFVPDDIKRGLNAFVDVGRLVFRLVHESNAIVRVYNQDRINDDAIEKLFKQFSTVVFLIYNNSFYE